jgi:hypothetical protein
MASNFLPNSVSSWSVSRLTGPNSPSDLQVGARNWIGSMSSGGTHILIRVPYCWKWHPSRLHKSTLRFLVNPRHFFRRYLFFRIGLGSQWVRFRKPKTQVVKNLLALSYPQDQSIGSQKMIRMDLSISEIMWISQALSSWYHRQ